MFCVFFRLLKTEDFLLALEAGPVMKWGVYLMDPSLLDSKFHDFPSCYQERGHLQLDPAHIFTVLVKDKTSLPSQVLLSKKSFEEIRKL